MSIELDEFVIPDGPEQEFTERFQIEDDSSAGWAMRRLRSIQSRMAENMDIANEEHRRITAWLGSVNQPLQRDENFFTAILTEYALTCRANPDDGRKTISLPAGKISTRAPSLVWSIDPDTFIPWAKENDPDLIKVKIEPALSEVKKSLLAQDDSAITADGEVVPGVSTHMGEPSATITTNI